MKKTRRKYEADDRTSPEYADEWVGDLPPLDEPVTLDEYMFFRRGASMIAEAQDYGLTRDDDFDTELTAAMRRRGIPLTGFRGGGKGGCDADL